jgi:hypothetical protein
LPATLLAHNHQLIVLLFLFYFVICLSHPSLPFIFASPVDCSLPQLSFVFLYAQEFDGMGKRGRPSRVRTLASALNAGNEDLNPGTVQCSKCNGIFHLNSLHVHNKHCQGLGVPPEEELTDDEQQYDHIANRLLPNLNSNHVGNGDSNSDLCLEVHQDDESSSQQLVGANSNEDAVSDSGQNPHNYAYDLVHRHDLGAEEASAGVEDAHDNDQQTHFEPQLDNHPHLPMSMNVRPGDFDDQIERNSKEKPLRIPIYSSHYTNEDRSKMVGMTMLAMTNGNVTVHTSVYFYFSMVLILHSIFLMPFWLGSNILHKCAAPISLMQNIHQGRHFLSLIGKTCAFHVPIRFQFL